MRVEQLDVERLGRQNRGSEQQRQRRSDRGEALRAGGLRTGLRCRGLAGRARAELVGRRSLARGIVGRCGAGDVVMCVFSHRDPGPWVNGCGCAHPGARGSAGMGKGQLKG